MKLEEYDYLLATRIKRLEEMKSLIETPHDKEKKVEISEKKIAIIYDYEGWAFNNIAKEIKKNLSKYYQIDIFPMEVYNLNIVRLMLLAKKYDLVHVLWRGVFSALEDDFVKSYIRSLGLSQEEFIKNYVLTRNITTSVYDHNFLTEESFGVTEAFLKYTKAYTVSSKKLKKIYEELPIERKPTIEITDGVDLEKFKPNNLEKFSKNFKRTISIGWVGNSKFTDSEQDEDLKGVRSILLPAIEELIKEGYPIQKKFADRNDGYIPHDKMPEYYQSIDVYICASKQEGTPNPVLEAMACGIPVISTDVGIVPEVFGEKQKKYILKERTKEELKTKIIEFIENPEQWKELSDENLKQIQDWAWEKKCEQFKQFFDENIK